MMSRKGDDMRKGVLLAVLLGLGLALFGAAAQDVSPADQQFFDSRIGSLVKLEPHRIDSPALSKVFSSTFYEVGVDVAGATTKLLVARNGENIVEVTEPSTTAEMPDFEKIFNPSFRLTDSEQAHVLQDALDILFPIDTTFDTEDLAAKAIRHSGTEWTFIRGKFFEHFKGMVFTTNQSGAVRRVDFSLEIK